MTLRDQIAAAICPALWRVLLETHKHSCCLPMSHDGLSHICACGDQIKRSLIPAKRFSV